MLWGGIGILFLFWTSFSAMVPKGKPGPEKVVARNLIIGEMKKFEPAFPPRGTPLVQFEGPEGKLDLSEFRGKVVLVNLWATWCPPCIHELPSLDQLHAAFPSEDFEVVAIAIEPRMKERGPAFFERIGIEHLALYSDPRLEFMSLLGGRNNLPVSILYDAKGNEIGRLEGDADWNSKEARALIQAVIDGQKLS